MSAERRRQEAALKAKMQTRRERQERLMKKQVRLPTCTSLLMLLFSLGVCEWCSSLCVCVWR
jgi:hypothetical protein